MDAGSGQAGYTVRVSLAVALGGFLMGFDASVISGVVRFIEPQFDLSKLQLGWAVASLTLTSTLAMLLAGPLSDRFGRRRLLRVAALLFLVSAVLSALAPDYVTLVIARMLGGLGVGAALIIAPVYIAEIAPAERRGRLVSFNQLNIVIGISVAFFSNYLILGAASSASAWAVALGVDAHQWRWMLGVEAVPAAVYLLALVGVPESPRWLAMRGRTEEAEAVLTRANGAAHARAALAEVLASAPADNAPGAGWRALLQPAMRLVLMVGLSVAVLQQITGINAVFFYAPTIFEQSGLGTDAAFMQAVLVGLVNLAFTVVAIVLIDRIGRRPLLLFGVAGVAVCMFVLAWGFANASYVLTPAALAALPAGIDAQLLAPLAGQVFHDDVSFRAAAAALLPDVVMRDYQATLIAAAIDVNTTLILVGILGFVASFAVSLGPVMWVLLAELFPNRVRGIAISIMGLVNSSISFAVQLIFPVELDTLGPATTFALYGLFAVGGLVIIARLLPETRGKSLEQLERELVRA